MEEMRTKQGYVMNRKLRARIVLVVRENTGITIQELAKQLGVNRRTISDYLTQELRDEIGRGERAFGEEPRLEDVDKAMMQQACNGNVAAARLVYMRMAQKGHVGPLPTLDELEAELKKLKQLEGHRHGESADDVAAVVAGAAGRAD